MKSISTLGMSREEWLKQRQVLGIGGSDVAAALGISQYTTPYQLWKEKVSDEIKEVNNKFTKWGNYLEDPIADDYTESTGRKVLRDNKIRIHNDYDCLMVNLDRVIVDNGDGKGTGILECKSTISFVYKSWKDETGTQSIPLEHFCQIQHELSVTGYKWAILAVLLLDQGETRFIPIERDEDYIQRQNQVLVAWWNAFVIPNVPPPLTAVEYNYVQPILGSTKIADEEIINVHRDLIKAQVDEKIAIDKVKSLKDKIKLFLEDTETLIIKGQVGATFKMINKKSFTVKETSYRQLNIKEVLL